MPDGTYAPQSPDLSSFLTSAGPSSTSTPPQPASSHPHPAAQSARSHTSTYTPRSPNLSAFGPSPSQQLQQQHLSPPPFGSHRALLGAVASGQVYQPQAHSQQQYTPGGLGGYAGAGRSDYPPTSPAQQQQQQQHPFAYPNAPQQNTYSNLPPVPDLPPSHAFPPYPPQDYSYPPSADPQGAYLPPSYSLDGTSDDMSGRVKRERKNGNESMGLAGIPAAPGGAGSGAGLGPSQGIEVRTKFPVARIKRIMQADEEVGKVAQVTPVAVSKALELFMISIVTKSASVAKAGNSKRITAAHLKKAIEGDEQFDFLSEIVGRVTDDHGSGKKGGTAAGVKDEFGDSSDEDAEEKKAKKQKKGKR